MNHLTFTNKSFHHFIFLKEYREILDETIKEFSLEKSIEVDNFYRNKNYTTDVLSFPLNSKIELNFLEVIPIGQIIISPWKIKKQAKEFNHSLRREFCYIFTHGIAHLLGFDHQTEEETKIMNNHVENIMIKLNIKRK